MGGIVLDASDASDGEQGDSGDRSSAVRRLAAEACDPADACDACDLDVCDGCDTCLVFSTLVLAGSHAARTANTLHAVVTGHARAPGRRTGRHGTGPALAAIAAYQRWLSPRLRTRCRYVPTCSAYGREAIDRYGLDAGGRLAAARIRRCRRTVPVGTADPVPAVSNAPAATQPG